MKHANKVMKMGFKYMPASVHATSDHLRETFRRERNRIKAEKRRRLEEQQGKVSPLKLKAAGRS